MNEDQLRPAARTTAEAAEAAERTALDHRARLGRGDRVALVLTGSLAYVELVLHLTRRGIVPVPLDPRLTESERASVLAYVDPAVVLYDDRAVRDLLGRPADGLPAHEVPAHQVTADPSAAGRLPAVEQALAPHPVVRPMHLTSGTTGAPKGVWSGLLDPAAAASLAQEEQDLWGFAASDVHLVLSPLHHSAPLRFASATLLAGGRVVVPGPFDPEVVTAAIREQRPTTMFCVPAHLQRLFGHWDRVGVPDLSSFRLVAHAGAACPPSVKQRLVDVFPRGSTWEFYGSTEGQFTACRSEEWLGRRGTVGRARPGRTLHVDDDGTVWCTVPEHARFTYWRAPEKTALAWRRTEAGPAFTVGDLGRLDEDGYLYLEGRREDLVISGGVNVYPVEVEHALAEHEGVREVAVFGVEDESWGQRVCAAVVGTATSGELTAFAAERLSPAKRPKEYFTVDALPHTATGKVKRLDLPGLLGLG